MRQHLPLALAASLLLNSLLFARLLSGGSKSASLPLQQLGWRRTAGGSAPANHSAASAAAAARAAATWPPGGCTAQQHQQRSSVLVVLSRHSEAIGWLDLPELAAAAQAQHLQLVVYQTPGQEQELLPAPDVLQMARAAAAAPPDIHVDAQWYSKRWPVRKTPLNRGHEGMAYITAILDHWEEPPDYFAFMHAHQWSTHTHFARDFVVRALAVHPPSLSNATGGYLPVDCGEKNVTWNYLPLDSQAAMMEWMERKGMDPGIDIQGTWAECCERWLGPLPSDGLYTLPNSEFVASSAAIRHLPRAFWEGLRDFLLSTGQLSFKAGVAMEWLWAYIITGRSIVAPPQADCMCQLYGLCLPT